MDIFKFLIVFQISCVSAKNLLLFRRCFTLSCDRTAQFFFSKLHAPKDASWLSKSYSVRNVFWNFPYSKSRYLQKVYPKFSNFRTRLKFRRFFRKTISSIESSKSRPNDSRFLRDVKRQKKIQIFVAVSNEFGVFLNKSTILCFSYKKKKKVRIDCNNFHFYNTPKFNIIISRKTIFTIIVSNNLKKKFL